MKIKNETPDQIVLEDKASVVMGPLFMIIGLVCGYLGLKSSIILTVIGVVFLLVGVGAILFATSYFIEINKSQIHYQVKSLAGQHTDKAYNAADVAQVITEELLTYTNNGQGNRTPQMRVQTFLLFKDGSQIPLDNQHGGNTFSGWGMALMGAMGRGELATGQKVATLLGVPYQSGNAGMPTVPGINL